MGLGARPPTAHLPHLPGTPSPYPAHPDLPAVEPASPAAPSLSDSRAARAAAAARRGRAPPPRVAASDAVSDDLKRAERAALDAWTSERFFAAGGAVAGLLATIFVAAGPP